MGVQWHFIPMNRLLMLTLRGSCKIRLKAVEFNGGTVSHKVFRDVALWNTAYPDAQAALICGEAGVWGNPSEADYTMLGYPGFCLQDQVQRQYIASFLVSMLSMQEKERCQNRNLRMKYAFNLLCVRMQ